MKMKLPKALLCAVLASLLVGHADATITKGTGDPDRPDVINPVASGTEDIKADYASYNGKVTPEEHKQDLALIYLKDGEGTATITGVRNEETGEQETLQSDVRLYVREGAVEVTDSAITQKSNSDFDYVVVAGGSKEVGEDGNIIKDTTAKMVLDNASIIQTDDGGYSGFMKTATIGNRDGEGTLILKNNSTLKTGQLVSVGNKTTGNCVHGTYSGLKGDSTYFETDDAKTGHVSIESGSKIYAGDGFTFANADITISGKGSEFIGSSRNINVPDWSTACLSRIGHQAGYTATISIEDGGALKAYNTLQIGKNASTSEITVSGKDADGTSSLFAAYRDVSIAGADGSIVNITAKDGAAIHMTDAKMGGAGSTNKVAINVNEGSSYTGSSLVVNDGVTFTNKGSVALTEGTVVTLWRDDSNPGYENSQKAATATEKVASQMIINGGKFVNIGTISAETIQITGGTIDNSGSISGHIMLAGGTLTMTEDAVAAGLTATTGTINLSGNVTFTGDVVLGSLARTTEALTINIVQGTTFILEDQFTLHNAIIKVLLKDDALVSEGEMLFTIASADGTALEALEKAELKFEANGKDVTAAVYAANNNVGLKAGYVANTTIPEPTTATLSLLALMGLAARRRRK